MPRVTRRFLGMLGSPRAVETLFENFSRLGAGLLTLLALTPCWLAAGAEEQQPMPESRLRERLYNTYSE